MKLECFSSSAERRSSALKGQGESVPHSEHAQIDPLVLVQLLVEGVQSLGDEVVRGRVHHMSTPQHLKTNTPCLTAENPCSYILTNPHNVPVNA